MKNRLKELRAKKGMTQEQLSKKAGISRPALTQIENGKTAPDGNTIAALVKALETPANEIFFDFNVV